eukprot:783867-Rhodomonas_salina.1
MEERCWASGQDPGVQRVGIPTRVAGPSHGGTQAWGEMDVASQQHWHWHTRAGTAAHRNQMWVQH